MADNTLLTEQKKAILRGEVDMEKYANPENEIHKIRSMVNTRRESLIQEMLLLQENGHGDLVDQLFDRMVEEFDEVHVTDLDERVQRLGRDIDELERKMEQIPDLRNRLSEIEDQL